jgi:hypothetical protein
MYSPGQFPFVDPDNRMFAQPTANTMIGVARRTLDGVARDVVDVGGVHLMRTTTNGASWEPLDAGHGDYCCFARAGSGTAFLLGTHGGVFRGIDFFDDGSPQKLDFVFFTTRNRGLGITQFYTGAFSPTSNLAVLGGTQDNGTVARVDEDDWRIGSNSDGGAVGLSVASHDIQFGSDQLYNVFRTENRWQTHERITPSYGRLVPGPTWVSDDVPGLGQGTFEVEPNDSRELYAGTNYLYRYDVDTAQWTKHLAGRNFAPDGHFIHSIKVARGDRNRVYVGGDGGLWMSQDHGESWARIDIPAVGRPSALPGSIRNISVHPTDKNDVVAIVQPRAQTKGIAAPGPPRIYRCANTTAHPRVWTLLSILPEARELARDIDDPDDTFYVCISSGVVKSVDGGQSWTQYGYELGLPVVRGMAICGVPATRSLWVATYGRGFWRMALPPVILTLQLPPTVPSGRQVTGTVSLGRRAQPGGENVWLTANESRRRLTVPGGETSATFTVTAPGPTAPRRQLQVGAAVGGISVTRAVEVV